MKVHEQNVHSYVCRGVTVDLPPFSLHTTNTSPAMLENITGIGFPNVPPVLTHRFTGLPAMQNVLLSKGSLVSPTGKVSLGTGLKTKPDVCVTLVSIASK